MKTEGYTYDNQLFVEFYDFIVERLGRADLDRELWKSCAELFGEPILEMGCGTGLQLLALAQMGYSVTGIDNSLEMLKAFEQKLKNIRELRKNVELIECDMVTPPLTRSDFRLIIFSGSQFLHLKTDEQRIACLKNSCRLLADDGVLIISNSKFKLKENETWDEWIDQPGQPTDEWTLQSRRTLKNGIFKEDLKLIPKFQGQQEHLFFWHLYPVEDDPMKELIKQAGLQSIPLPSHLPVRQNSYVYLCMKNI